MCTVTWIPASTGGHFLTSNRDEAPLRAAVDLAHRQSPMGEFLHYPVDQGAGGTWFCISENQRAVCLLNGAKRKHKHAPPYRRSRGLIVLDAYDYTDFNVFVRDHNLNGVEPFTMILAENDSAKSLIWNGRKKEVIDVPSGKPCIWSSSTLYPYQVREKRRKLFSQFIAAIPEPTLEDVLQFHQLETGDIHNGFIMNRENRVRTISITATHLGGEAPYWIHKDLLHHQTERRVLLS
jgi:hypothetical protein